MIYLNDPFIAATGGTVSLFWDGTNWVIHSASTVPPSATSPYSGSNNTITIDRQVDIDSTIKRK